MLIVVVSLAYLALGLLIALPLMVFGSGRIDPATRGASLAVRVLLVPGAAALWPVMLSRSLRGAPRKPPTSSEGTPNPEGTA